MKRHKPRGTTWLCLRLSQIERRLPSGTTSADGEAGEGGAVKRRVGRAKRCGRARSGIII